MRPPLFRRLGLAGFTGGRPPQDALAAGERFVQRRPNSGQARRLLAVSASAMRNPGADELADTQFREARDSRLGVFWFMPLTAGILTPEVARRKRWPSWTRPLASNRRTRLFEPRG